MDAIPLFLNDGSYPSSADDRGIEEEILHLLRTLKSVKALSRPFVVGTAVPLSEVPFTNAYQTLAAYAAVDREWWRFIKALDQRVPFNSVPQCVPPETSVHVVAEGAQALAPLWALKNDAFMVSFPTRPELRQHVVGVAVCSCVDELHAPRNVDCRNLSIPEHVEVWRDALLDFSYVESASSTIYEDRAYRLKMYLHDHEPPHVHVYQASDFRSCVGRVRFDHVEVMEDDGFSGAVKKDVLALLEGRRTEFLRAWDRCRAGSLPIRIDPA
jgi:hypothetical protein